MKLRTGLLLTCAASALAAGTGLISPAVAADKAVIPAPATESWWYTGYLEVGGRFFLNNPQRDGISAFGGSSLAKYYEYSSIKPGPFADGWAWMGSGNGLYEVDLYGKNVGYSDQRYQADFSKAGEHYLNFVWDQTPHVYSTSALTLFNVNGNTLTLPTDIFPGGLLFGPSGAGCSSAHNNTQPTGCVNPLAAANAAQVAGIINSHVHNTDIGIRRDTAALDYRWTPTDAWDVRANYSNMRRTGTQVDGVVFTPGTSGVANQVTKPVADTTQNFGASGEWNGISPWNQKINIKVAYNGSTYRDDWDSYTVQNPFCPQNVTSDPFGGAGECARQASPSAPIARMSLWPDNQANGVTGTVGADLPFNSRYMGTVSFNDMTQNQAFIPFTISQLVFSAKSGSGNSTVYSAPVAPPGLPYASLNGDISTLLSNNVLTTQITPDLKSKATYRYYNFQNNTPELFFSDWVETDTALASAVNAGHAKTSSISMSYKRQNAGEELTWSPTRAWNIGASYGWERYDRTREDVDVTNENTGKVFADYKPFPWLIARGSVQYGERRYDNYDYLDFVGLFQWQSTSGASRYSPAYRQFFLDNRNRNVGKFLVAIDVAPGLTVTPSGGWRNDDFLIDPTTQEGLMHDRGWYAGVETAYAYGPGSNFLVSYMYERRSQLLASASTSNPPFPNSSYWTADITDTINTVMVALNQNLIPDKLDLRLSYTLSYAVDSGPAIFATTGAGPSAGQFPDVKNTLQQFDAIARYRFDDDVVRRLGLMGKVYAKVRYAWERNSMTNWQYDEMMPYMFSIQTQTGYQTWMAYNNPNYNVHLLAGSVAWAW